MTKEALKVTKEDMLLGIDYGDRNTGVAFGRNGLVTPIKTISGKDTQSVIHEIVKLAIHNKVSRVVVGLPLTHEGKDTMQTKKVRHFTKLLKIRLKKPVTFIDEFGSTIDTMEESIEMDVSQKDRKKMDHITAAIILKKFFSEHPVVD
jgi:putative holliday junction resolvase